MISTSAQPCPSAHAQTRHGHGTQCCTRLYRGCLPGRSGLPSRHLRQRFCTSPRPEAQHVPRKFTFRTKVFEVFGGGPTRPPTSYGFSQHKSVEISTAGPSTPSGFGRTKSKQRLKCWRRILSYGSQTRQSPGRVAEGGVAHDQRHPVMHDDRRGVAMRCVSHDHILDAVMLQVVDQFVRILQRHALLGQVSAGKFLRSGVKNRFEG